MSQQAHPPTAKPKVAVSYSWKEEREGGNKDQVSRFQQLFIEKGVEVIRDNNRVKYGENLREFMEKEIAGANHLCVFLSEGYLKSPHCTHELLAAWELSGKRGAEFSKRVKAWIMPGLSLKDAAQRVSWVDHWTAEIDKAEKAIEGRDPKAVSEERAKIDRLKEFALHINAILNYIEETLQPRSLDEFVPWVENEFKLEGLRKADLLGARGRIIEAIESKITGTAALHPVFEQVPDLGRLEGGRFKLFDALKTDTKTLKPVMFSLLKAIKGTVIESQHREALRDIVGGIVALGIRPSWVQQQIQQLDGDRVVMIAEFGQSKSQAVQSIDAETSINLLHVLSSALAGGAIKAQDVFVKGPVQQQPRGPARVLTGISKSDQDFEIKEFFVRFVSPDQMPTKPTGNAATAESLQEYKGIVETMFAEVRQLLEFAYDNGTPWSAADPAFKDHVERIRRLGLFHVIFLIPTKGAFNDVFEDFMYVLSVFQQIDGLLGRVAS